jgi:uncharacterized protein (TIGR03000 family)
MYSMVLMVALTGGAEVPDCHRSHGCHGCRGGCYGGGHGIIVVPDGGKKDEGKKKDGDGKKKGGTDEEQGNLGRSTSATLVVTLPADAKLTVDGYATTSTSSVRRFTTPPLDAGRDYYYTLKAEVMNDGKTEVITKRVMVRSGQVTETTLTLPVSTASAR